VTKAFVGWGYPTKQGTTVSTSLAQGLRELGIEEVFTIVGGGIAPLIAALRRCGLRIRHFRHEGGAAFAAHEASIASGTPVAVCVTTGPGIYNALTAMAAARADGGRILLLSGSTSPGMLGRGAVQETGLETMPAELFAAGPLFHYAKIINDSRELPVIFNRLKSGFARAGGFSVHLSLPLCVQDAPDFPREIPALTVHEPRAAKCAIQEVVAHLEKQRFGLWIGHGARSAADEIREFVKRTGCGVIATPRAKGVFPEDDPHYVGVSGAGAHPTVQHYVQNDSPAFLLVVGTRLGEVSSFWSPHLVPREGFIHVDVDSTAFGAAYPQVKTLAIRSESRAFFQDLLDELPTNFRRLTPPNRPLARSEPMAPRQEPLIRTPFLMQQVQHILVEGSEAVVMSESGNAFAWANHSLRFISPDRYRTSAAFGSMGHFVTGVVGAALGRRGKAAVLAGDGAMLMNNEINTAVAYDVPAIWIVLNDARFGLTERGMQALELEPIETRIPRTNFALFAQSQGAEGIVVEQESELADALEKALAARGPFVVDVRIDPHDVAPMLATRIASLRQQRNG
jgi:acetolactate synthase I/II/III large subunit